MRELVSKSIDYIIRSLKDDLTVKSVADHFHYSEFHFARLFKAETGESVYAFIKRLKMDQSAIDLKLKHNKSITEIGSDYGYSPSNYSSAFKKHTAASPAQFRKTANAGKVNNPFYPARTDVFETYAAYDDRIKIEELPDLFALYERMIGSYADIKENWLKFISKYREYFQGGARMFERFYDDPSVASPGSCICDLCLSVDNACPLENVTTIRGGRFAVYRYEGAIADIFCAVQGVFSVWLSQSRYEMRERYGLSIYREIEWDHNHVVMDLCIPIQ